MSNENSNLTKIITKYYLTSALSWLIIFFITLMCGLFLVGVIDALLIDIFNMGDDTQKMLFKISSIIGLVLITTITMFLACKIGSLVISGSYTNQDISKITKNATIVYALSFVMFGITHLFRNDTGVDLFMFLINMVYSVILYYYFSNRALINRKRHVTS